MRTSTGDPCQGAGAIDALIARLESANTSLEEKNRAVWVLGELRDERALATLRGLHASETCDHSRYVCQHEVRKAQRKITGEVPNPFFWQRIDGG